MSSARASRRSILAAAAGLGLTSVAACSPDTNQPSGTPTPTRSPQSLAVALHQDGRAQVQANLKDSNALVRALFAEAGVAVLADPSGAALTSAIATATALKAPLLITGPTLGSLVTDLRVRRLVSYATVAPSVADSVSVLPGGATPPTIEGYQPRTPTDGSAYVVTTQALQADPIRDALLALAGAKVLTVKNPDPRSAEAAYDALSALEPPVIAVGSAFGPAERFEARLRTRRHAEQLPGGGFLPFPDRMMVALYGHPESAALGMLGEQSAEAAVKRVKKVAAEYAALTATPVIPAFELIATVAAASPGKDGDYSRETAMSVLRPWVETAIAQGCYVVLDLQPGRTDFLTQAKVYEELLLLPQVGIALDPEWRLGPKEKHLVQIGHVGIAEVNAVAQWLATLVREHDLPPKVFTLHQFQTQMIRGREQLRTDLDELQFLLHVDGSGGQGAKRATWGVMREGLPKGVFLGWKNFKDEDFPMLTVAQTMAQVKPTPNFVSYQ